MSITLALCLFLAGLFARSAWHKLSQYSLFQGELSAYQLLPNSVTPLVTNGLIALEIFCAAGLLFSHIAVILSIILLLVYGLAMAINLWRGRRHIDCGCGGWLSPRKTLSWALVWRNLLLASLGIACLLLPAPANLSSSDIFLTLLVAFTLWLLYETAEQLLSNWQQYNQWKKRSSPGSAH